MNERFYKTVRFIGARIFFHASAPRILHAARTRRPGGYLLVANHHSAYDVPLITATTQRVIYWLSIAELFRNPLAGWFLRNFGAEPLDRRQADPRTVRAIVRHLRAGRVVGIFPEGGLRGESLSVVHGGGIQEGVCKLAELAKVPVLPCAIAGSARFKRWSSWLPRAGTRWAVAYGEPIFLRATETRDEARRVMREEIVTSLRALYAEIADHA